MSLAIGSHERLLATRPELKHQLSDFSKICEPIAVVGMLEVEKADGFVVVNENVIEIEIRMNQRRGLRIRQTAYRFFESTKNLGPSIGEATGINLLECIGNARFNLCCPGWKQWPAQNSAMALPIRLMQDPDPVPNRARDALESLWVSFQKLGRTIGCYSPKVPDAATTLG